MAAAIPFIGLAFTVIGVIQQANAESANAKAQAQALDYNAQVSRNQSYSALQESSAAQNAQRRRSAQVLGSQRAAAAQSGVGFGGTTGQVLEESGAAAELDQLNIAYEGELRSKGFLAQADLDAYNASRARTNAKNAKTTGYLKAGGSLFSFGAGGGFGGVTPKSTLTGGGGLGLRPGGGLGLRYG